jgi:hypothetical protein
VLPPRTAQRMSGGLEARGTHAVSHKTAATVAPAIGIDTGHDTLHLIGLDDNGAIVLREKIARGRIAARLANVPRCLIVPIAPYHITVTTWYPDDATAIGLYEISDHCKSAVVLPFVGILALWWRRMGEIRCHSTRTYRAVTCSLAPPAH